MLKDRIKERREQLQYTQEDVAARADISVRQPDR